MKLGYFLLTLSTAVLLVSCDEESTDLLNSQSGSKDTTIASGTSDSNRNGVRNQTLPSRGFDFNGDGIADVVYSGAYVGDGALLGRAYVFFGQVDRPHESSAANADVIIEGEVDSVVLGAWPIGDFNNDGLDDFVVQIGDNAYLYYGDVLMPSLLTGQDANIVCRGLGLSGRAGDFDGDGFDDVIMRISQPTGPSFSPSAFLLFRGGGALKPELTISDASLMITPGPDANPDNAFLSSRSGYIGDVNGDGLGDLMFSDPFFHGRNGNLINSGAAFIFYGRGLDSNAASLNVLTISDADFTVYGDSPGELLNYFDSSVASRIGDVNGDGVDDVGVLSLGKDEVLIFFGGNLPRRTTSSRAQVVIRGSAPNYHSLHLSGIGDVDGDGFDDLLIGAPSSDDNGTHSGTAYIYRGGPDLLPVNDRTHATAIIVGNMEHDGFGRSIAGVGDVNGDGRNDFVVSAKSNFVTPGGQLYGQISFFNGAELETLSRYEKAEHASSRITAEQEGTDFFVSRHE